MANGLPFVALALMIILVYFGRLSLENTHRCDGAKAAYFSAINNRQSDVQIGRKKRSYHACQNKVAGNKPDNPRIVSTDALFAAIINRPVNSMIELNYKSKEDIYQLRTAYVQAQAPMIGGNYAPMESIFGQIQDGKPWWGMLGKSYYGNTENSILGAAEESRFITNPLLLVGLDAGHAVIVSNSAIPPLPVYPIPRQLYWQKDGKAAGVRYDLTTYREGLERLYGATPPNDALMMVAYNARDFGWNYLYVDPAQSSNVQGAAGVAEIRQFIHTGGSCGFPGGCNNMSPEQPELDLKVEKLPAVAAVKLWKNPPADPTVPPDMLFIIEMK